MRVGLTPTPAIRSREPGRSVAATTNGAAEEKSPGTVEPRAAPGARPARPRPRPGCRSTRAPAARSIRSVWSRVGDGLDDRRRPAVREQAREEDADFTCALATGSSYSDRRGAPRLRCGAAGGRRSSRRRRPSRRAASRSAPSDASESDSSPVSSKLPVLAGEQAGEQPQQACLRCRSRSARRLRQAAQADTATRGRRRRPPPPRRRAREPQRSSTRCRPSGRSPRSRSLRRRRTEQHGAVRDRLVAGNREPPWTDDRRARSSFARTGETETP